MSEFSVLLSGERSGCDASGCREKRVACVATLAYCCCDEIDGEHGHPGSPEADRNDVNLCERHGALIRSWECLERISTAMESTR